MISLPISLRIVCSYLLLACFLHPGRIQAGELVHPNTANDSPWNAKVVRETDQETRGGGGLGIRCGKDKTLYSLAYLRTKGIKKIKGVVSDNKTKIIKLNPGISLQKPNKQSKSEFCSNSLTQIHDRFAKLARSHDIDANRREMFDIIATSMKTYQKQMMNRNYEDVGDSNEKINTHVPKNVSDQDIKETPNGMVKEMQWVDRNQAVLKELECDLKSMVRLTTYNMTIHHVGGGVIAKEHTFSSIPIEQRSFEIGAVSGDESDYQCSYHHLHEILRLVLNDSASIDIYLPLLHSKFFLQEQRNGSGRDKEIAYLLAPESNPSLDHLRTGRIRSKKIDAFNPFLTFPEFEKNMIDASKLLEAGTDPFLRPSKNDPTQGQHVKSVLRVIGKEDTSNRRTYSLQMLNSFLASGPSEVMLDSGKVLKVGEPIQITINNNKETFYIYGITPEKIPILMRVGDLSQAERAVKSGKSVEFPLWIK